MQDGMLAHYLGQAKMADANVEARIEREPFDFRLYYGGHKDRPRILPRTTKPVRSSSLSKR